ncbi:DUF167 domain-containing protein [bacterium]|nr:DUF167 domain-containing protein [bacterium]
MSLDCLSPHAEGCVLRLRVTPGARRTTPEGILEGRLRLRVQAPPVEGKANEAVIAWAVKTFALRKSAVTLLRGDKSRQKDILLAGITAEAAEKVLENS